VNSLKIGDIVARKSYNADISFVIDRIEIGSNGKPVYILRGLLHRIQADTDDENDLIKQTYRSAIESMKRNVIMATRHVPQYRRSNPLLRYSPFRAKAGKILHIDSSREFIDICMQNYKKAGLHATSIHAEESKQPELIRGALGRYRPDILVVTGHDGIKKGSADLNSINSYRNSKYYIQSVKEARNYEPNDDKLCIFAGACQSYYEGIMNAGANFASSPGRILINALDPAIVAEKVALTSSRTFVTPEQISRITVSGADGIWGKKTRGHLKL